MIVKEKKFICDIIRAGKDKAIVRRENTNSGELTEWITVDDPINADFQFGDYLIKKL